MDEAEREREQHETRRLLYVAMTRARDRLYLSSSLKDGELAPGRGSLADVLPDSIEAALRDAPRARWRVSARWPGAALPGPASSSALCVPPADAERRDRRRCRAVT